MVQGTPRAGGIAREAVHVPARTAFVNRKVCQKKAFQLRSAIPDDADVPPRAFQTENDPISKLEDLSVSAQSEKSEPEDEEQGLSPPSVNDVQSTDGDRNSNKLADWSGASSSADVSTSSQTPEDCAVASVEIYIENPDSISSGLDESATLPSADAPIVEEVASEDTIGPQQEPTLEPMETKGYMDIRVPRFGFPAFNFGVLVERLKFWGRKGSYVPLDFKVRYSLSQRSG